MRSLRGVVRTMLGCAVMSLAFGGAAAAQEQDSERGRTLDEVVVTAQKREQNVQDVPIVITAVSGQLLQDTGVHDIKDLTVLVPGLIVTSTSNETSTTARIRGMGTVGDNIGLESSVGVVIDEVYRPRNGVGFGDLGELERIEVLKGPQGTLFGKNTSAGVINVKTKAPSFDVDANIALTAGNLGQLEQAFSLTGPLVGDKLAGRIFLAHREHDGFLDVDTGIGPRVATTDMDRDVNTVRGQLLWRASETFEARLIADWSERNEQCCIGVQYVTGPTGPIVAALSGGAIAVPADPFARTAYANRDTIQDIRDHGASLQLDWDLAGGATLTSVTAWRNWETENGQDSDFSGAGILFRDSKGYTNTFETLTQELRLAGNNGRLTWLVGAFYADEDLESINALNYDTQFEPYVSLLLTQGASTALLSPLLGRAPGTSYSLGFGSHDTYAQSAKSWALFTNNSFAITDQFEVTLGLRYTDEEKNLTSNYDNVGDGVGCAAVRARQPIMPIILGLAGIPAASHAAIIAGLGSLGCANFSDPLYNDFSHSQKIAEGEWSGTAKLSYRFTDDAMGYASYARGYKASGFNLDRERTSVNPYAPGVAVDTDTSFAPEEVDSYELGLKTTWAGNSLALNAAAFYQEYTGFQLNTFTGTVFVVASIPEVTSQGVDFDFTWFTPLDSLSFQGGITYADTQYGDFVPSFAGGQRLPGARMSFAPEWSGTLAATFEHPIGANLKWRMNVGAKYMSDFNTGSDLNPTKDQDAFTLVDARIGIGSQSDSWALELWGRNVFDEDYIQLGFDATLQPGTTGAFLGNPQTYGATFRLKF